MNEEKHWKMPDWIRMNMISKEGALTMAKVFITLTGTKHYFGNDFLEKGTKIRLEKEPDWRCCICKGNTCYTSWDNLQNL